MEKFVHKFIQVKQIDSFQKLHFVLFLQKHPDFKGTRREFAERLHLKDLSLLNRIILDLEKVKLLTQTGQRWGLPDEPELTVNLELLVRVFENPLARQKLLKQVKIISAQTNWLDTKRV